MQMDDFIQRVKAEGLNVYGIRVIQDGNTVGSAQFADDIPYSVFSAAKSFMVTAVGIAVDDGLLALSDRPVDVFSDHLPDDLDERYGRLTLEHLLMMASGHGRALLMEKERLQLTERDWIRYTFEQPLVSDPGTKFQYSNASAYLAGVMVEKAAGATIQDYLYEKLFRPMGVPYPEWGKCPLGHTFTPTRLYLRIDDMAKLGLLYLNKGEWETGRILSAGWVEEATRKHIDSNHVTPAGPVEDEYCGYGYQFWMCRYPGVYRAFGREGQHIVVVPDRNAVVAVLAEEPKALAILEAVWDTVLPRL